MAPEIAAALNASTQTAKDKGRQHNALKPGSKKKRSKAELDEVRNVEAQLKSVSSCLRGRSNRGCRLSRHNALCYRTSTHSYWK